jgi:hypothetical protein
MELAKMGFFQKSEPNSSFAILSQAKKTWAIFSISAFEKQQLRNATLAGKRARKSGQTVKQPNREHVQNVGQEPHFGNWAGVCYQFLHIPDFEITALILHHDVF